jgi:hypothetical protein
MSIKAERLKELIIQEATKALDDIEETNRKYAPSPVPSRADDEDDKRAKKSGKKSKRSQNVNHSVDHEDNVTGNIDNVGKIIEKLTQIVSEEVANVISEIDDKDKHHGHGYYMSRSERERERNAGLASTGEYEPRKRSFSKLSASAAKIIDDSVTSFLEKMNDPASGHWPETWKGGGRVYLGQEKGYRDRTEDENAQMRDRFDDFRERAGRNPFKPEHIAVDLKQSGSSAWGYPEDGGDRYPSLSSRLNDIVDPLSKRFSLDRIDMSDVLAKYLSGEMEITQS